MSKTNKTALVTGANAGLGFEAAAQLAADGWGTVILACRSEAKAKAAAEALTARTGKNPFSTLVVDTSEVGSAQAAADTLGGRGVKIDFLLLNAGASGKEKKFNADGVEVTYASTLVGHHVLTMRALQDGLLSDDARIVIAGSEGARGNIPGMVVHDIAAIAEREFSGDVTAAIEALVKLDTAAQSSFVNMNEYVTAKLVVAWWAAALARKVPAGMVVTAVSPGAAPNTSFARDAPWAMRMIMLPMMKAIGPLMGMSGSVEAGARRYLDAAEFGADANGGFFATAHKKKLVGPMGRQSWPDYFGDVQAQDAGFAAISNLTKVSLPTSIST